jgi:hypothetical protein
MQPGDRVMVYDSPGFPVDHYLFATVLQPFPAGAVVLIEHPGNLSDGKQKYVSADKILRSADAKKLADQLKAQSAAETDPGKRQYLIEHAKGMGSVAEQLAV